MIPKFYVPLILSFIIAPLFSGASYCAGTPEELAREFITGIKNSTSFEKMKGIFLTENDFDSYVLMLRKSQGISQGTYALVTSSAEVEKARKVFLKELGSFKKTWDTVIKKITDGKALINYASHTMKTGSREGITIYEIEIICQVMTHNKKSQGSAKVYAVMLDGKIKIADFQYMKI